MVKIFFVFILIILSIISKAQKIGNSKIIVQVSDTTNLYKRVKFAFIKLDFIVKDLETDTLKTYAREFMDNNYLIATAIIKGYTVTITGIWGSRKLNLLGYSNSLRDYKSVIYYKGCVEWNLLRLVGKDIGGELSFED